MKLIITIIFCVITFSIAVFSDLTLKETVLFALSIIFGSIWMGCLLIVEDYEDGLDE